MNKEILRIYIKKLTKENIKYYCDKNNININNNEIDIIYYYIINYWEKLYDKDISIIYTLKNKINDNLYNLILEKYNNYIS